MPDSTRQYRSDSDQGRPGMTPQPRHDSIVTDPDDPVRCSRRPSGRWVIKVPTATGDGVVSSVPTSRKSLDVAEIHGHQHLAFGVGADLVFHHNQVARPRYRIVRFSRHEQREHLQVTGDVQLALGSIQRHLTQVEFASARSQPCSQTLHPLAVIKLPTMGFSLQEAFFAVPVACLQGGRDVRMVTYSR